MFTQSRPLASRRLQVEQLENRMCLSLTVAFEQGVLTIDGTSGDDSVLVRGEGRGITTVVDGNSGQRWEVPRATRIVVVTGEGNDFLSVQDRSGDVKNIDAAPGGGNDSIWIDLGYPVQTAVREPVLANFDLGAGNDMLRFNATGIPDLDLHVTGGDGDDNALIGLLVPAVQKVRDAAARVDVDLGGGNDRLGVTINGIAQLDLTIAAGDGNDFVMTHQGWGKWEVNPASQLDVDLGSGDDRFLAHAAGATSLDFDLNLTAGDGDDRVLIGLLVPAVQKVRESAARVQVDLGAGNNRLAIRAVGVPQIDLGVTAGGGDDHALIGLLLPAVQKVRGSSARIRVDLGEGQNELVLRHRGYETVDTGVAGGND